MNASPSVLPRAATLLAAALASFGASSIRAETRPSARLSLPDAPVVLRVPEPAALDRALGGGLRAALSGTLPPDDPAWAAFRRTRVGGKLAAQWSLFAGDVRLDWPAIAAAKPSSLGVALLSAGNLEAVLALRTPLAEAPLSLPAGKPGSHRGVSFRVSSRGAGDDPTASRRLGVAVARHEGVLFVATSERAIRLAIDASLDAASAAAAPDPPAEALATLDLDLDALRKDLYFRREFLFAEGRTGPGGRVRATLGLADGRLVETREGDGESRPPAPVWDSAGRASAAAWETDASRLFDALRRGLLEPEPQPSALPLLARRPIPDPLAGGEERYVVDLRKPAVVASAPDGPGELPEWATFLAAKATGGFGWEIGLRGERRLVLALSAADDKRFAELALATVARRAGRATAAPSRLDVGPSLPALAWRRTGAFLWIASRPEDLDGVPEPRVSASAVRWSRLDLAAVRAEAPAWARAEGAPSGETTRPFSDRVLGLLGWAPSAAVLSTERTRDGSRWREVVTMEFREAPPRKPAGGAKKGR